MEYLKQLSELINSRLEKDQWKKTSFGIDVSDIIDFEGKTPRLLIKMIIKVV